MNYIRDKGIKGSMTLLHFHGLYMLLQVAVGPSEKAKFYSMKSGSNEAFAQNLERQFPTEKAAIQKLMQLLKVSVCFCLIILCRFHLLI